MEVAADDAVGDGFGVDAVVDADVGFDVVVVAAAAVDVDALSSR